MLTYKKDDFDESLEDIMESVNKIINKTMEDAEVAEPEKKEDNQDK